MTVLNMRQVLDELVPWLRASGSEPFLWGGTLLGYWRSGNLLPWDGDIDLGLLAEDASDVDFGALPAGWQVYRETKLQPWMREVAELNRGNVGVRTPTARVGLHFMARGREGFRYFTCKRRLIKVLDPAPLEVWTLPGGESVAIPADPVRALEWYYGPGWVTPDPTYIGSERERANQRRYFIESAA